MNKKLLLISFVFSLFSLYGFSQKKVMVNIDYGYLLGLKEKFDDWSLSRSDMKMSGNSLHVSALYPVSESISLGAGVGLDRYLKPEYNTMPIFAAARFAPLSSYRDIYAFTNVGYSIGGDNYANGALFDIGIGYKWMVKPKFGITFKLGYNMKVTSGGSNADLPEDISFSFVSINNVDHTRHSLVIGAGVIF